MTAAIAGRGSNALTSTERTLAAINHHNDFRFIIEVKRERNYPLQWRSDVAMNML